MVGQVVLYIRKHGRICRVAFLIVLLGISMKSRQTVEGHGLLLIEQTGTHVSLARILTT